MNKTLHSFRNLGHKIGQNMKNKQNKLSQLKNKAQQGFTLIELMLVLGLATLIALAAIQAARRDTDYQLANAAATQMQELNVALSRQISNNAATYTADGRRTITLQELKDAGLLPNSYKNQTPFGGTFSMEVISTVPVSAGAPPTLTGLITTTPWLDDSGEPRYDLLGAAIRRIGAQGGVSFYRGDLVSGLNGGWSAPAGTADLQFSIINAAGQLAVRSYGDTSGYDNIYLRRDGTLPMLGNLDMGFYDINNAVNISANGWVNANHIAANDATIGSVFSHYIRNTGGIDTRSINGVDSPSGERSTSSFALVEARKDLRAATINESGNVPVAHVGVDGTLPAGDVGLLSRTPGKGIMNVQDLYIRDARGSGTWLSDRLPKFSSRGIYFVTNDDTIIKPEVGLTGTNANSTYSCNYGATVNSAAQLPGSTVAAKIEIIPQTFFTQGKTDGLIDFDGTSLFADPSGVVFGTIQANPDLNTVTNFRAYATETTSGGLPAWKININNWGYYSGDYPFNSGWALAHVYCDYS